MRSSRYHFSDVNASGFSVSRWRKSEMIERQADRRFGGRDGHDEERDDLPVDRPR